NRDGIKGHEQAARKRRAASDEPRRQHTGEPYCDEADPDLHCDDHGERSPKGAKQRCKKDGIAWSTIQAEGEAWGFRVEVSRSKISSEGDVAVRIVSEEALWMRRS